MVQEHVATCSRLYGETVRACRFALEMIPRHEMGCSFLGYSLKRVGNLGFAVAVKILPRDILRIVFSIGRRKFVVMVAARRLAVFQGW